ncbi:hypothetical protein [Pseudoxanthomonas sp. PXM02]|uniref:hypothetical protein n=1 Tax=Pseudoxanthomonas sp. PXM02 TaxID=2769294 RepID=UPI00177C8AAD|nr:hypothetical protein [Pseudoxanthomonas sp. PXM02]MBD9478287.1 hypothetical protein [Pseudoxanthomonas sp. PXM02]
MRRHVFASVLCIAAIPAAHAAPDCSGSLVPPPLKTPATVIAPVAPEFTAAATQLGAPSGVLASHAFDESQSVDRVLMRLRIEGCRNIAKALPAAPTTAAATASPAAYQPKTAHDNTPWRFDMSQNGKRMTADEFDAWMKSRGVRVVKAPGAPAAAPAPAPVDPAKKN